MSAFRPGDRAVEIGGRSYRLRFTVSALAELADAFDAASPSDLASRLRAATPEDWITVLRSVSHPRLERGQAPEDIEAALPILTELIRDGLRG